MKNFTQSMIVMLLALFGFCMNAVADTVFNFNAMDVAVSSNDSQDGDITENLVLTQDGVTLTVSPKEESNKNANRFWGTTSGPQLRCYSGMITIESASTIKSIVFDAPSKFSMTADSGELTGTTWNGDAKKIVFTVGGNSQINKITVSAEAAETPSVLEAADIAAFKALDKGTEALLMLKNAYVTAVSGNNAYVQDASGALYFYNTGLTLEAGKVLNGTVTGKLDIYNNLPEFVKTAATSGDGFQATDGTATAKGVTVAEALTAPNISMLVKVSGATIAVDGNNYYAQEGDAKIQIYDSFKVLPEGFQYPEKADIVGIVGMYKGTPQLYPLDSNSITDAGGSGSSSRTWDFTKWSDATVANLKADAAASKVSGWSDVEKKADAEANADPTDISKDNCFWYASETNADGSLSANGVVIEELKGLVFSNSYAPNRSLAIAVNYPSTTLGDYAGGAYLWLGGGKKKIPCFTIPGVAAGSTITMEIESHKLAEGRGVELYYGLDADGLVDAATKIGDSFNPKTKESHTWTVENAGDVIVYNTNGCHVYTIVVTSDPASVKSVKNEVVGNNSVYNLRGQKVNNMQAKGIYIVNGKKIVIK